MSVDPRILGALETLASRLGDVTSRLEKLEATGPSVTVSSGGSSSSAPAAASSAGGVAAAVEEFRRIVDTELAAFMKAACAVGGDGATAANNVLVAFQECSKLLDMASQCEKPSDLPGALSPLSNAIGAVSNQQKPRDRKDPQYLLVDMVQGAIGALCFVAADAEAEATVSNNVEIMRYTGDKILMTYRRQAGAENIIAFENTYTALWKAVAAHVKQFHPVGLKWKAGGIDISNYSGSASNTTAPAPTPAPAPAPKPAAKPAPKPAAKKPAARVRPEVNERVGFDQIKLAYCKGTRQQKENRKIVVENEKKDAVTIMDCEFCNIEIVGIPKAIMVTGCKKYWISVPGCLTAVNIDNSDGGSMDLAGPVKTMQVDKCSDLDITLKSEDAYECNFVSANVSGFNLYLEKEGEEGTELIQLPVPTQFETVMTFDENNKPTLVTTEMAGMGE